MALARGRDRRRFCTRLEPFAGAQLSYHRYEHAGKIQGAIGYRFELGVAVSLVRDLDASATVGMDVVRFTDYRGVDGPRQDFSSTVAELGIGTRW